MARTIVIANQKGGVGKTTTATNLAAALARAGKRTALIDLDPQGALTVSHGLDPYKIRPSTFEVLFEYENGIAPALRKINSHLFIAPSSAELGAAEYRLMRSKNRILRLKQAIHNTSAGIDIYIIDTPPSLGLLTVNALVAGKELLIPVATDYLAMRGVRALLESVWLIHGKANPDLQLLALVPTLHHTTSPHAHAVITEMRKVFQGKVSKSVIPYDPSVSAAPAARRSILDFAPHSAPARAYTQLAEEVLLV